MYTTFTVPADSQVVANPRLLPDVPVGWHVTPGTVDRSTVRPGQSVSTTWTVTAPDALNTHRCPHNSV